MQLLFLEKRLNIRANIVYNTRESNKLPVIIFNPERIFLMKPLTKRKQQALDTKNKIYKAAVGLFKDKGYENVTVSEICQKAGVSVGCFYNSFPSKDQLILEEFVEANKYYERIYLELPPDLDYLEKIVKFMDGVHEYSIQTGKERFRASYCSLIGPGKKTDYFLNEERPFFKITLKLIEEGQKNGILRREYSPREITLMIVASMYGYHYTWLIYDDFDLKKVGIQTIKSLLNGLCQQRCV